MSIVTFTRTLLATSIAIVATSASAQFAPRINSEDIEGAIMPAIPFPANDRNATAKTSAPQSLGLAPDDSETLSISSADRPQEKPVARRRAFSAQETADRLLAQ